jgi:hypothetical protein
VEFAGVVRKQVGKGLASVTPASLHDLGLDTKLISRRDNVMPKLDFTKIKSCSPSKNTMKKVKGHLTQWEKRCTNPRSDKRLTCRLCKEPLLLLKKKVFVALVTDVRLYSRDQAVGTSGRGGNWWDLRFLLQGQMRSCDQGMGWGQWLGMSKRKHGDDFFWLPDSIALLLKAAMVVRCPQWPGTEVRECLSWLSRILAHAEFCKD